MQFRSLWKSRLNTVPAFWVWEPNGAAPKDQKVPEREKLRKTTLATGLQTLSLSWNCINVNLIIIRQQKTCRMNWTVSERTPAHMEYSRNLVGIATKDQEGWDRTVLTPNTVNWLWQKKYPDVHRLYKNTQVSLKIPKPGFGSSMVKSICYLCRGLVFSFQ